MIPLKNHILGRVPNNYKEIVPKYWFEALPYDSLVFKEIREIISFSDMAHQTIIDLAPCGTSYDYYEFSGPQI